MTEVAEGSTHVGVRVAWRTGTKNFRESTHRSCATAFQSFRSRSRLGWRSHCNITSSETWSCRFLLWPSPSPLGMRESGLPCWPFYCPRPASTTSLRSRFTPSTFPLEIYLTFSFLSHGRQLSPRSVLFDAESRTAFVKPATTFMSSWNSADTERTKFSNSTRNSANGLRNSKRPTRNWNPLPIPSPTTCGRHFAIWSGTRSCYKDKHRLCSTRRVSDSYERFSTQQKEWAT